MTRRGLAALPPQTCALALGINGLGGLLAHWVRLGSGFLEPLPLACSGAAALLAAAYFLKLVVAPAAVWQDLSSPAPLAAVGALPAVFQLLVLRFNALLPRHEAQGLVLLCHCSSLVIALRFALLNWRQGALPDPSWGPGLLMIGLTNVSVHAIGPDFLREWLPFHLLFTLCVYAPLTAVVAYRILISKVRDSVAPHAGMAVLMSPSSFYCLIHLSSGKPWGDELGIVLFALSTLFFLATVFLLIKRRGLWAGAFHVSYVAFTFPLTTTAAAALLAAERLPAVQTGLGQLAWVWAAALAGLSALVVPSVLVRFVALAGRAVLEAAPGDAPAAKAAGGGRAEGGAQGEGEGKGAAKGGAKAAAKGSPKASPKGSPKASPKQRPGRTDTPPASLRRRASAGE